MQDNISGWTDWSAAFNDIPELNSPAELHGLLTGIVTVARAPTGDEWQHILAQLGFEWLSDDALQLLTEEAEDAATALGDDALDYAPLLPDDDHSMAERVTALADWCGGVLLGFGLASGAVRADETEILRDLQEIASMQFEDGDDDEEGEEGYADLVEFARLIPVSLSTGREKISLAGTALLAVKTVTATVSPSSATAHSVVEMFAPDRPS
jgi:uncharacterized protein YgfB (UPF0149 family)